MTVDADHYNNPLNDIIKMLDDKFNEDELGVLCFELDIDFDDFEGNIPKRCRSLVKQLDNENRLNDLLDVIEKQNLSLQTDLEKIRARLNEIETSPAPSSSQPPSPPAPQPSTQAATLPINPTYIIIAVVVVLGLVAVVYIFANSNNRSQESVSSPSSPTSVAEIIKPTIEEDTPEPKPTDIVEPTEAIIETAVPEPTHTTEPAPTAVIEQTDIPTSVPTETPLPTDTPIPTETPLPTDTPTPLIELGLLSTSSRDQDNQRMFYVPAGSFQMGASSSDKSAEGDEYPRHEITLKAFWIDESEVTNQQYQICVDEGVCNQVASAGQLASTDNYPRVNVTWNDALTYCNWVGATLPTEAQWEYAARGTDGRIYPWGNDAPTCQKANYAGCVNYAQPVKSSPNGASWSGALDMSGNVYEWVSDWYNYNYYQNSPANQPLNAITANAKVRRGGSYFHSNNQVRATNRDSLPPTNASSNTGFRCVVNIID